jgi:hypothetical protein
MLSIGAPLLWSFTGYDAASSGAQRAAGAADCLLQRAQSRGNIAAERARHTISAGCIEAKRDKYQRAFKKALWSPFNALPRCGDGAAMM